MITPSKTVSLSESALGLSTTILCAGPNTRDIVTLYSEISDQFETVDDFILALDLLYVLGRVNVDMDMRALSYVA